MVEGYCVKCRQKREIKDPKEKTTKRGTKMVQGTCPVCGIKVNRMGALKKE